MFYKYKHCFVKWQDVDIAFNKPVNASSILDNKTDQYGPQYATNGKAVCNTSIGPVAQTDKKDTRPFFTVDLQGEFNITTVVVKPWICKINYKTLLYNKWLFFNFTYSESKSRKHRYNVMKLYFIVFNTL